MLATPEVDCDYETVYEPSEDSFLLLDVLESEREFLGTKFETDSAIVCELGVGSGVVTTFLMMHNIPHCKAMYWALDINPWALKATIKAVQINHCDISRLTTVNSDLFTAMRPNTVDLLIFNPPYVPAERVPNVPKHLEPTPENRFDGDQWLDLALMGGEDGMVVTQRVLDSMDTILSPTGVAYILFCARNKPKRVIELMMQTGMWIVDLVMDRKAGWEILSVYRFQKNHVRDHGNRILHQAD